MCWYYQRRVGTSTVLDPLILNGPCSGDPCGEIVVVGTAPKKCEVPGDTGDPGDVTTGICDPDTPKAVGFGVGDVGRPNPTSVLLLWATT